MWAICSSGTSFDFHRTARHGTVQVGEEWSSSHQTMSEYQDMSNNETHMGVMVFTQMLRQGKRLLETSTSR
jgi:hypothetical protein